MEGCGVRELRPDCASELRQNCASELRQNCASELRQNCAWRTANSDRISTPAFEPGLFSSTRAVSVAPGSPPSGKPRLYCWQTTHSNETRFMPSRREVITIAVDIAYSATICSKATVVSR